MLAEEEVLGEPDESAQDEHESDQAEQSVAVPGATTPLGTGPTYPNKSTRKRKKTK